ncbi:MULTISPECIES: ShlB/FhaC/HecB family hemolysin secretion/activation protein [unclassified Polaribacter]|uniref:ShlB/FhaC/HecB family hemolysin secretion/activation protein n=1 Tax=unclassified Polaribacter TaxID=196858 RepID=UPI0011BDE3B8|nr:MULTISPECIES: ShlB/FhaC/HecB family hemolysin secretion/activation protein [unclassified Polaribacter]TXD54303.1 hypothetical protein ES043_00170 [Polaribacter sp. IC063]TXD62866.1 hypothetical protein ES044_00590 [Polaribacter sp. IC066]
MNQTNTVYLFLLLLFLIVKGTFAQDFSLNVTSKHKVEADVLEKMNYKKKHKDTITLKLQVDKISDYLKTIGYFATTLDSINNINNNFTAYYSLFNQTKIAFIQIDSASKFLPENIQKEGTNVSVPINLLQSNLNSISKNLDRQGKSFSKVQLKNIKIKNDTLFADLNINESKKRIIDDVIIKGYPEFPRTFLKNYFNIQSQNTFNQQKITKISTLSKNLRFVKEIKPPEALFTADSTQIFLYLKKQSNNSLDGIVGFASKENGELLFNGIIDLKLHNILNTGEKFELFWNSIGEERQEFKLATDLPYVFNSKISPQLSFSLYKQDSSFLNTKFDSKLLYSINPAINFALTYNSASSENLKENLDNNIETFSNYFLGFEFQYTIPSKDFFFNDTFAFAINPTFGRRKTNQAASNQFKIETTTSFLWNLGLKNSVFIQNKLGYLQSDSFLDNELFRIGGANSIRGFDEQSIFANNYTYFNIEYRYLTSQKSYLYSITDIGAIETRSKKDTIFGLGLGYLFTTNNSQITLSTVIGANSSQNFNIKNSKLIINWVTYF